MMTTKILTKISASQIRLARALDQLLAGPDAAPASRSYSNMLRSPFIYYNTTQHTYWRVREPIYLVAGECVGKTTLLYKYVNGTFIADTSMTIGVQFHVKNIELNGVSYSLRLWDFAGQNRWRFMFPSYTLGAKGALLFYDTTRMSTLDSLEEWVGICRTQDKNLPILFCGTKIDLVEERSVAGDYAKSFLQPLGLFDYIEVSAKTGQNVERLFETLVRKILGLPLPETENYWRLRDEEEARREEEMKKKEELKKLYPSGVLSNSEVNAMKRREDMKSNSDPNPRIEKFWEAVEEVLGTIMHQHPQLLAVKLRDRVLTQKDSGVYEYFRLSNLCLEEIVQNLIKVKRVEGHFERGEWQLQIPESPAASRPAKLEEAAVSPKSSGFILYDGVAGDAWGRGSYLCGKCGTKNVISGTYSPPIPRMDLQTYCQLSVKSEQLWGKGFSFLPIGTMQGKTGDKITENIPVELPSTVSCRYSDKTRYRCKKCGTENTMEPDNAVPALEPAENNEMMPDI